MERTGHKSSEAVRSYKRSSNKQLQQVSDILKNGTTKRSCHGSTLVEAGGDIITQNTSNCVSDSLSLEYNKSGTTVFNISSSAPVIIDNYNYPQK